MRQLGGVYKMLAMKYLPRLISIIVVLVGVPAVAYTQEITGQILSPSNGGQVPPRFEVAGTVANMPDGYHLWVAVRRGNLLWPKEPEAFVVRNNWDTTISEGGKGRYKLILLAVDRKGQNTIKEWVRIGRETSHYPGLESITGSLVLHSISVVAR